MQKVNQYGLHVTATSFDQQQQPISPKIYQNETQNMPKTL